MATGSEEEEPQFEVKFREDEELEFFTELALHETERWITAVTKKTFAYPDDTRKSLENGILLCELLNCLKAGSVRRINKLPTPIAGIDNLNVFLKACREHFGLNDTHLFDPSDLEDLSNRAIADSEHLKDELDRRLRNVAITVYWLGRVVSNSFQGPKLDQSAFSALVHNQHRHSQHLVSDSSLRRDSSNSWESNGQSSSAYGSHEGCNSRSSLRETLEPGPRHVRDGSYDSYTSYGKGSEDSLDEHVFEVDEHGMPIPRHGGSSSALHRADRTSQEGSMYSDRHSGMYRSSPDLFHSSVSKRRSSSTDSADGSYHGSHHSRQSSDSTEMYPTRRYSQQHSTRKSSVSADPLQFIKSKGATDLAHTAEEQIKLAAETKKIKFTGAPKEDDTDWQSNLNSWKSRRKSQSERSYQMKEELEQMEREKEEPRGISQTKTFSQMKEERERRKSAGSKHFYPIADDDEEENDEIFTPTTSKQQESSPAILGGSRSFLSSTPSREDRGHKLKGDIASWAQNSDDDEEVKTEEENNNSTSKPRPSLDRSSRFSADRNDEQSALPDVKQRRSGLRSDRDSTQKTYTGNRDSTSKEDSRNGASATASGKSQNKISNILKNFEQKEEESTKPRSDSLEHSVSVSARKKSFENSGARGSGSNGDSYRSWSTDQEKRPARSMHSETSVHAASAVYASNKHSGKDFVEKMIKISQKPNSERGFGFTLSGGADKRQPVVVEKVGLGSAADVCELQTKDEVVAINGNSVARMTAADLNQKVKESVRTGQIELRIKRVLGSAGDFDEDDEDFLSSEEELDTPDVSVSKSSSVRAENSFDSLDSREEQQAKTEAEPKQQWIEEENAPAGMTPSQITRRGGPTSTSSDSGYDAQTFSSSVYSNDDEMSHSLTTDDSLQPPTASRRTHFYPYEQEEDNFLSNRSVDSDSPLKPAGQRERETLPSQQVEVESRPVITMRKEVVNAVPRDESKPLFSSDPVESSQQDSDGSDFGPPAALRKWQRQRPRTDYTFESDEQPFYNKMRLSSTLPRSSAPPRDPDAGFSKDDSALDRAAESCDAATRSKPSPDPSTRRFNYAEDRRRMEDWNTKQELERQPVEVQADQSGNAVELQFAFDKRQFEADRDKIQHQYHADLQRAADVERQKQDQERELLEPEMEKLRILEERRAQRQARLQQYAQDAAPTPQHTSSWSTQLPGNKTSPTQPGVLVIDPRNRGEDTGQIDGSRKEYQIHLKINQEDTPEGLVIRPEVLQSLHAVGPSTTATDQAALLEAEREHIRQVERERIRQEELQKIEAERQRKEEDEMKRIRSMEEQLQQQQEMLRQKEEELRRNEERLERERQQLQQQAYSPAPEPAPSQEPVHFETVTSKVRGGSPALTSTVVTGPRRSEGRPNFSGSRDSGAAYGSGYGPRRSEPAWDAGRNPNPRQDSSWRGSNQHVGAGQSGLPRWPPSDNQVPSHHDPGHRLLSREDMLAMNRKATPLQAKPPSPRSVSPDQSSVSNPVKREAPSKGQLHSLNSVPRARIRQSEGWISPRDAEDYAERSGNMRQERSAPAVPPRRSDGGFRSQLGGSQDHWLIQEAERRRMHDTGGQGLNRSQFSGPIRPVADGNRWRDDMGNDPHSSPNMPAQIRQTLLQKTAGARGSTGSNYSQELNPPPHQPRISPNTSMSQTLPPNYTFDLGQPSRPDAMPPPHRPPSPESRRENGMPVSGKQRCSHCSQELGFGAAMVIESLGLFYHVQCFRCCVCHTPLGNGVEGADVRVRVNKLHCPNCYSNEEAGLKFSKV